MVALEKWPTESPLDPAELGSQGRLGHTELSSGLGDAANSGDRGHDLEVSQFKLHDVEPTQPLTS